jgi:hypothetical protein
MNKEIQRELQKTEGLDNKEELDRRAEAMRKLNLPQWKPNKRSNSGKFESIFKDMDCQEGKKEGGERCSCMTFYLLRSCLLFSIYL